VELSTDVQCIEMEDERNSTGGMGTTEIKKESATGFGFPARNLLSILEARFEDIDWAPPHV
jgi:hypothetical protein